MGRDGVAEDVAERRARLGSEELHVRHVEPNDQTKAVGQIEIEPVRNLDMAAQRVEAHRLGVDEPLFEKLRIRWAALFFRMPVLIERAEHGERPSVEDETSLFRLKQPEPHSAVYGVDHASAVDQLDCDVIEIRSLGRPWVRVWRRESRYELRGVERKVPMRHGVAGARQSEAECPRRGLR
jgi:hypothetical protein